MSEEEPISEAWYEKWLAWSLAMILLVGQEFSQELTKGLNFGLTAWHELGHVAGAVGTGGWVDALDIAGPMDGATVMLGGWSLGARWMGYGGMILWSFCVWYYSKQKPGRMLLWGVAIAWLAALLWAQEESSVVLLLWLAGTGGVWLVLVPREWQRVVERAVAWVVIISVLTEMLGATQNGMPLDAVKLEMITLVSSQTWVISWGVLAMLGIMWGSKELVSFSESDRREVGFLMARIKLWSQKMTGVLTTPQT